MDDNKIFNHIKEQIDNNKVVLFMKGTKTMPQCGFSNMVVQILQAMNIEFQDINVLSNENLRQGIKDFSNWPTIPQLYVNKEFIGGYDIVRELYDDGELKDIFKQ